MRGDVKATTKNYQRPRYVETKTSHQGQFLPTQSPINFDYTHCSNDEANNGNQTNNLNTWESQLIVNAFTSDSIGGIILFEVQPFEIISTNIFHFLLCIATLTSASTELEYCLFCSSNAASAVFIYGITNEKYLLLDIPYSFHLAWTTICPVHNPLFSLAFQPTLKVAYHLSYSRSACCPWLSANQYRSNDLEEKRFLEITLKCKRCPLT